MGSSKSRSICMIKHTWITSTSIFLQGLILQYLQEVLNIVVSLHPSLPVSLQDNIWHHLYRGISTVISLQSSLFTYLRNEFLQSSLLTSLRSEFLQSSLSASLRSEFLQTSLLPSLWNNISAGYTIKTWNTSTKLS